MPNFDEVVKGKKRGGGGVQIRHYVQYVMHTAQKLLFEIEGMRGAFPSVNNTAQIGLATYLVTRFFFIMFYLLLLFCFSSFIFFFWGGAVFSFICLLVVVVLLLLCVCVFLLFGGKAVEVEIILIPQQHPVYDII